ncbi:MAG TPA: alpha/beta fold hydrolase [Fimbriimonadaceae bacterium]|nr:alpha/beta fold hydrolase [Fimbriimonadaceae bacterium]HRJ97878.1 alpha/beta fold hydrolase [Fimbriimonadaceae bacterium]
MSVLGYLALGWALLTQPTEPLPRKALFGAQLRAPSVEERTKAGLKEGEGVALGSVLPNLSAEGAGLKTGDIVVRLAGRPVATPQECIAIFRLANGGDTVDVEFVREGKRESRKVRMVERPKQKPDGFDVVYDQVVSQGKRIRLILTKPHTPGKHPVVMLIGGIGAYSVDGDFGSIPYGNIFGPIAKAGYATARIDKPGQGDSEGPIYPELGFGTELEAYRAAIRYLKTSPSIDPNKVFIFGHSMGGTFGPILAAEEPLAGLIVGGTLVKSWSEYMLENTRRQSLLSGAGVEALGEGQRRLAAVSHYLFYEGKTPDQIAKEHPELADQVRGMSPDGKTYSGVGLQFFKELAGYNLEGLWTKVKCPAMVFWGENDFISGEDDHKRIVEILGGKGEYVRLSASDHGFFKTTSFRDSQQKWGRPGSEFNPVIVEKTLAWLGSRTKAPG